MKFAFKVFYLGKNYLGFQRQPNGQTVENYLELAFIKANHIVSFADNNYKGASRTDNGVNAYANVFTLDLDKKPNLQRINYYLPRDIMVWSYCKVSDTFSPRHNIGKHYRYLLSSTIPNNQSDVDLLHQFVGEHDFSSFIKKHGAGMENPTSFIYSIEINKQGSFYQIDIHGNKFGREQIRMMIGLISKGIAPNEVFTNPDLYDIRAASPQFLWLVQVNFNETLNWQDNPNLMYKISDIKVSYMEKKQEIDNYIISLEDLSEYLL